MDAERIDRFNRELDAHLGIQSPSPEAVDPADRSALDAATHLAALDLSPESKVRHSLRTRLLAIASAKTQPASSRRTLRRLLAFGLPAVILLLLFVFRQPVIASVSRLFGYSYLPGAGFILMDESRVLAGPVIQEHDGQRLTVVRGLTRGEKTELWLEFAGTPIPLEGAWLIKPNGERIDARFWQWLPDGANPTGGYLLFPALSAEANPAILALPQGWRLQLDWIPARDADLPSTELVVTFPAPTPLPGTPAAVAEAAPTLPVCDTRSDIQVCLQSAFTDANATQLLLEISSFSAWQMSPDFDPFLTDPLNTSVFPALRDTFGYVYPLSSPPSGFDPGALGENQRVLFFAPASPGDSRFHLSLPAVYMRVPTPQSFEIDLGASPQPGTAWEVDIPLQFAGQSVRLSRAELSGDGTNSLTLKLTTDPVQEVDGKVVTAVELGKPEGIEGGFGYGFDGTRLEATFELIDPRSGAVKNGILRVPVTGAILAARGPFDFIFPNPASPGLPAPTQVAAHSQSGFAAALTAQPLNLDTYFYDGRAIQGGDLLFTYWNGAASELYAASPESGFQPQRVAVLPGRVISVKVHPDKLGIDYVTGSPAEANVEVAADARVFRLRFADARPTLLYGPVPFLQMPAFSADGSLLYYASMANAQTADGFAHNTLALEGCSSAEGCSAKPFVLQEGMWLFRGAWSPNEPRMAFAGTEPGRSGAHIYLVDVLKNTPTTSLRDLMRESPTDNQWFAWNGDGRSLRATCQEPGMDPNAYNLCTVIVPDGGISAARNLPPEFTDIALSPDGTWLAGPRRNPGEGPRLELRALNLNDDSIKSMGLAENFGQVVFSPDGHLAGWIQDGGASVSVVDPATGAVYSPFTLPAGLVGEGLQASWVGWGR